MLLRLIEPDGGKILFDSRDLLALSAEEMRAERRQMQMIFQDPYASLNPRMRVGEIVAEPLCIHEPTLSPSQRTARAAEILRRVGLAEDAVRKYPHEFSGGQRQRIGIARALILRPKLIVADPVSSLMPGGGFSSPAGIAAENSATYIFISSLPVVAQIATHTAGCARAIWWFARRILSEPTAAYTQG
jgi:ABC-type microcin C transport system duplicated ATPase subunit YejF